MKERLFYSWLKEQIAGERFDCILCSTFNLFPLPTAARIAQETGVPLVADFRDIDEQWGEATFAQRTVPGYLKPLFGLYRQRGVRLRNRALQQAGVVTTISPWHQAVLQKLHPRVELIYNGFDEERFRPTAQKAETFRIVYTGRIYDFALRNPELLFRGLQLVDKTKTIEVDFYCEEAQHAALRQLAKRYDAEDRLRLHQFVGNDAVPALLAEASICLLLTNRATANGPHGILTTKFYEALGMEKPVLCVPSDKECLAQVMEETNAGLAAETPEEVAAFIEAHYAEWLERGYTRQAVRNKELFNRKKQAEQFESLFCDSAHL
jgi:glycosyltransferase involved in cell wall biosynthesis